MSLKYKPRRLSAAARQRGQAALITVLLVLGIGAAAFVYALATPAKISLENDKKTAAAMAMVKDAIIGWSAARTPPPTNARPGELPCPDIDNTGTDPGGCTAGAIGRVPWKSLRIPEPKDGTGETLWYAIAGPFRYYHPMNNPNPITSDTLGSLIVYLNSTATTLTTQAVAIIFAPGVTLNSQNRDPSSTAFCTTTGTTIARNLCAANYLELENTSGVNNAKINGPFIQAQPSPTFNDRLLVITAADLMPVVEQRVAREMIRYLNSYRQATGGIYPWADLDDGNSDGNVTTSPYAAYNRNRFPCGNALPTSWAGAGITLPNWLTNGCAALTGWASLIYYAVAANRLEGGGTNCTTCSATTLTINNPSARTGIVCTTDSPPSCAAQVIASGSADLALITPGAYTGNPARNWPASWTTIAGYFEDAENSDNDNTNDTYVVPTSTAYNRDRIYIVR